MNPATTTYRLAQRHDMRAVHALLRAQGLDRRSLGWPVIVAVRDGAIIGALATTPTKRAVVAGPMAVSVKPAIIVAMRLVEAYELVLRMAGVHTYLFHVAQTEDTTLGGWHRFVRAVAAEPVETRGPGQWYRKRVA